MPRMWFPLGARGPAAEVILNSDHHHLCCRRLAVGARGDPMDHSGLSYFSLGYSDTDADTDRSTNTYPNRNTIRNADRDSNSHYNSSSHSDRNSNGETNSNILGFFHRSRWGERSGGDPPSNPTSTNRHTGNEGSSFGDGGECEANRAVSGHLFPHCEH